MKYIYIVFVSALYLLSACKDVERGPIDNDGIAPQPITDIEVQPLPGGAKITYKLPSDPDLLYVEALYTLPNGEKKQVNASYNGRSVTVEGFAEVKEYEVTLTCVDRSGNRSEARIVTFTPNTPPVISVFNGIKMQADFGGINLQWENPSEADLAIIISAKDEYNKDKVIDTYYTSAKEGNYSVRGMESVEAEFSVKVRDKWNNYSQSKRETLTPIYEAKLNRSNFKSLGQAYVSNVTDYGNISKMWDDNFQDNIFGESTVPWFASMEIAPKPIRLSRVIIWQYAWAGSKDYGHYYYGGNGKKYEIYGSNELVDDLKDWTLLQTLEIVKPSGLPMGYGREYMSDEDFDLAHNKGHEAIIPLDAPAVRYIRIRSLEGFEGTLGNFSEIHFYGNDKD